MQVDSEDQYEGGNGGPAPAKPKAKQQKDERNNGIYFYGTVHYGCKPLLIQKQYIRCTEQTILEYY